MKFALDVPNSGKYGDPKVLVDLAVEAESSGWDGFFIWDHLVSGGRSPVIDTWTVLPAIAGATKQIRFGPMVTPLARRRPWIIARQAATLDRLSDGRLIIGVGLGQFSKKEFGVFGDEPDPVARGELLDESLDIIAGLWSGEPFAYDGRHFHLSRSVFRPVPVQVPRVPVWVGGRWPNKAPMRRAARWDGAFAIPAEGGLSDEMTAEETGQMITYVNDHRTTAYEFEFVHAGLLTGHHDVDALKVEAYAEVGTTWWLEQIYSSRMTPAKLAAFIRQGPPSKSAHLRVADPTRPPE